MAVDAAGSLLECIGASMKLIYLMFYCHHNISSEQRSWSCHWKYLPARNDGSNVNWIIASQAFLQTIRDITKQSK